MPNREPSGRDEHGTFKALLVVIGGVVAALHVWKLSPALSTLSEQLDMSLGQAGVLVAVIQVAGMVLGMVVGLFNDSIGLRRGCLWGFGFLAVGSIMGSRCSGVQCARKSVCGPGARSWSQARHAVDRRLRGDGCVRSGGVRNRPTGGSGMALRAALRRGDRVLRGGWADSLDRNLSTNGFGTRAGHREHQLGAGPAIQCPRAVRGTGRRRIPGPDRRWLARNVVGHCEFCRGRIARELVVGIRPPFPSRLVI